jgi:hypothetical protein
VSGIESCLRSAGLRVTVDGGYEGARGGPALREERCGDDVLRDGAVEWSTVCEFDSGGMRPARPLRSTWYPNAGTAMSECLRTVSHLCGVALSDGEVEDDEARSSSGTT